MINKDRLFFFLPMLIIGILECKVCLFRKIPILGKHTKKITCGAWSKGGLLALGSEDKTLTISNADGDTVRQASLRDQPSDVQFSEMKMDERSRIGEDTVSVS